MKELHFYFQSLLILMALALAVQLPEEEGLFPFVALIQCLLGVYQYGMSWFLLNRLKRPGKLLLTYFFSSSVYLLVVVVMGVSKSESLPSEFWRFVLFVLPWGLAVFFVVVIEDLLWIRRKLS